MTNDELDTIARAIRDSCQLTDPDYPRTRRKLLRSIEISALREALEVMRDNFVLGIDHLRITHIKAEAIAVLETKIRDLELQ